MTTVRVKFTYRFGNWRVGDVVDLPSHIANALTGSPSPNGEPFAEQLEVSPSGPYRPDEEAEAAPEGDDLEALTVEELKDELRARDLKVSGTKDELISRLQGD